MRASASRTRSRWSCKSARTDGTENQMTEITATEMKAPAWRLPAWLAPLKKLYVQVLVAIAFGLLLGVVRPGFAVDMKPLSDAFITLIRAVVPPIIFATVAVGIAKMGDMRRVGAVGLRALIYFEVVSTIALVVGPVVGNSWQPGAGRRGRPTTAA